MIPWRRRQDRIWNENVVDRLEDLDEQIAKRWANPDYIAQRDQEDADYKRWGTVQEIKAHWARRAYELEQYNRAYKRYVATVNARNAEYDRWLQRRRGRNWAFK